MVGLIGHLSCDEADAHDRKYKNGAVGTLLHAISLHGVTYSIELEVYADGVSSSKQLTGAELTLGSIR